MFVLYIALMANPGGVATISHEHNSLANCEMAKTQISEKLVKGYILVATCAQK